MKRVGPSCVLCAVCCIRRKVRGVDAEGGCAKGRAKQVPGEGRDGQMAETCRAGGSSLWCLFLQGGRGKVGWCGEGGPAGESTLWSSTS